MTPACGIANRGVLTRRSLLSLAGAGALAVAGSHLARAKTAAPSRGINIAGWFDREDGVAPTATVLEKLRHSGFETVRLPIDGDVALAGAPALRTIRGGIETLLAAGFAVLVDLHPAGPLHTALLTDPVAGGERVAQAWMALRPVIADLPFGTYLGDAGDIERNGAALLQVGAHGIKVEGAGERGQPGVEAVTGRVEAYGVDARVAPDAQAVADHRLGADQGGGEHHRVGDQVRGAVAAADLPAFAYLGRDVGLPSLRARPTVA